MGLRARKQACQHANVDAHTSCCSKPTADPLAAECLGLQCGTMAVSNLYNKALRRPQQTPERAESQGMGAETVPRGSCTGSTGRATLGAASGARISLAVGFRHAMQELKHDLVARSVRRGSQAPSF